MKKIKKIKILKIKKNIETSNLSNINYDKYEYLNELDLEWCENIKDYSFISNLEKNKNIYVIKWLPSINLIIYY